MPRLSTNRIRFARLLEVDEVTDERSLLEYLHTRTGTPYPTKKDIPNVKKALERFFNDYPDANYRCLTDLALWARQRRKHTSMVKLIGSYRYAYEDGFMRILERGGSTNDDKTLRRLLKHVDDEDVRRRMMLASSSTSRDEIYERYISERNESGAPPPGPPSDDALLGKLGLKEGQVVRFRLSLADPMEYGTIVGASDDRVLVHSKVTEELDPHRIYVRNKGDWECL